MADKFTEEITILAEAQISGRITMERAKEITGALAELEVLKNTAPLWRELRNLELDLEATTSQDETG